MKSFAIIGGGASGTLLAVNLIKKSGDQPIIINLIEQRPRIGRGVAYSAETDWHRLNVRAINMGAFPDNIGHFYQWLTDNDYNFRADDYVPRRIYGDYLQALFDEAVRSKTENVTVNRFHDEALDISVNNGKTEISLKSGEIVSADKVILAFGNFLPPHVTADTDYINVSKYFQNPWDSEITEKLDADDDVLIIGTGLTAVDSILSFYQADHAGKIYALSTHGWFPEVHKHGFTYPNFADELANKTSVYELLKIIRSHLRKAEEQGINWRAVIDSLRPATQSIWLNLPEKEKRRFMRRLRRMWDVSRHRIPAECANILKELKNVGQLQIRKGRINKIRPTENNKFEITYINNGRELILTADAVINCTGSESDFSKLETPLIKSLISKGYIKPDSLRLGLDAQPNGRITETLYTIGTSLKGILWESVAMPEIRAQAAGLAEDLLTLPAVKEKKVSCN